MISSGAVIIGLAVITLLISVAAIFGSFRVSRNTAATTQYRETALAWEGRARAQEMEITDLKRENEAQIQDLKTALVEKDKQVAALTAQVQFLQDTVTGKAQLDMLDRRTQEMMAMGEDIKTSIKNMHEYLRLKLEVT